MSDCWIGLGSNQGNGRAAFEAAWESLRAHPQIAVQRRSGLYQTLPVGRAAGGTFLNAVCGIATTLAPLELLDLLQSIEATLGRTRELHWGPRTLDLDLLLVDEQLIDAPRLIVPHPAAAYRRFVVDPLVEVAPTLRHPVFHRTIAELWEQLQQRPLSIGFATPCASLVEQMRHGVASRFPAARLISLNDPGVLPDVNIRVCLHDREPFAPDCQGAIIADLRTTPGDSAQRVFDFLTAVFDEPKRIGDW